MNIEQSICLEIASDEIFADPEFRQWHLANAGHGLATFQHTGQPIMEGEEFPDTFFTMEFSLAFGDGSAYPEGTDSNMPEHIWKALSDAVQGHFGGIPKGRIVIWLRPAWD